RHAPSFPTRRSSDLFAFAVEPESASTALAALSRTGSGFEVSVAAICSSTVARARCISSVAEEYFAFNSCWFKKLMSTKPSAKMTSTEERNTEPITRTWIEVRHLNSRRYHKLFAVAAGRCSAERHVGLSGPDAGATSSAGEGPAAPAPAATAPSAGCVPSSADTAGEALSPG